MPRLHPLTELLERLLRHRRIKLHHQIRGRTVPQIRVLVRCHFLIRGHIRQHRTQPRPAPIGVRRIRQRLVMTHLRRLKKRQLGTVRIRERIPNQPATKRLTRHLIHHIRGRNHNTGRIETHHLTSVQHPVRVPVQRRVNFHAGQQITGGAARPRTLELRQHRRPVQLTRATRLVPLETEPSLRKHHQTHGNARRHDRVPLALERVQFLQPALRNNVLHPVERELFPQTQIVRPRELTELATSLTGRTEQTTQHQRPRSTAKPNNNKPTDNTPPAAGHDTAPIDTTPTINPDT